MAVAVKNSPETASRLPFRRLAVESCAGVVYVLGCIGLVFYGLPALWEAFVAGAITPVLGGAVSTALLIVVVLAAAIGLAFVGLRLPGPQPSPGLRAGIFFGAVEVLTIAWVTCLLGNWAESSWAAANPPLGIGVTAAFGLVLLVAAFVLLLQPRYERWLVQVEQQGWFSVEGYKRTQGQKVRRGTILGILALAAYGIYTLLAHKTLETAASPHWQVRVPFTDWDWVLLPDIRFTVPLLLAAGSLWLAYRVVNYPTFADFLIATEAELNKVSWTTRKRLVQDTIVVLTTVILLTLFLFFVDQLWSIILSRVGVIQMNPTGQQNLGPKEVPW
jgi:preprotein translocase SecE subunit